MLQVQSSLNLQRKNQSVLIGYDDFAAHHVHPAGEGNFS